MNRQVKRNIERFPEDFMFQITKEEFNSLKCQNGISNSRGGDRSLPYAFTEQGVSMLAGLLRSSIAINANIAIIRAFTAMRRLIAYNSDYFARMERIEARQLESEMKITELFNRLDENENNPRQGIFFDGQIYDAYAFVSDMIRSADKKIILIDNYIDDTVLTMLDIRKHNEQYRPVKVYEFRKAHDRFLIIDDKVYLIGASIKDLGKKWFGFTLMECVSAEDIISRMS